MGDVFLDTGYVIALSTGKTSSIRRRASWPNKEHNSAFACAKVQALTQQYPKNYGTV